MARISGVDIPKNKRGVIALTYIFGIGKPRAIEILDHIGNDTYIEIAEKELGYQTDTSHLFSDEPHEIKEANRKIFDLSSSIEEKEWIELFEILRGQDKENYKLLSVLIKSYAGYAFGVHETLAIEDEIAGVGESQAKRNAIIFYTRAFDYGLLYLKHKGIKRSDLLSNDFDRLKLKLKLFDEDDVIALLYTAQSWGSLINLQKDNIALVSQIPNVKLIFDHVCSLKPNVDFNVCDMFFAQYESTRPKILGGNPEKGEALAEVKAFHLENLPIKDISLSAQQPFIDKADLMLSLNKDFQTISQKFATYFSADNKLEKLSTKLSNWYELDFPDFIKELNKAIKTAKGTPLTKKDEFEWMELFEENKQKALALKAEIDKTDKEIDQMVYELYGLTEEEIGIVEGN
jgi:ribosomal protein S13